MYEESSGLKFKNRENGKFLIRYHTRYPEYTIELPESRYYYLVLHTTK
jgi:hypothetical protein